MAAIQVCCFTTMKHCLATPAKLFLCSSCGHQTRMCTSCLNSRWCPKCRRTSIPLGDILSETEEEAEDALQSLSHDETYETTSAYGSDSSCSAMTLATLEVNCVLAQTPKKRLTCSFCGHSTPMCVDCLNDARCPNCHRKDIPLGDVYTDDEDQDEQCPICEETV